MSRQTRAIKRLRRKRKRIIIVVIAIIIFLIVAVGYYRSNLSFILREEDYLNSQSSQIYFLRDSTYFLIDDFTEGDLAYPVGTKVSGYNILTNSPMTINQDYLNSQIASINALIAGKYYEDWGRYSQELQNTVNDVFTNNSTLDFFKDSARYSLNSLETLHQIQNKLQSLNTGRPIELTLNNISLMATGFVASTVSEYDKIAGEVILSHIDDNTLSSLDKLSTNNETALRIINNDHCYALATVNKNITVQGEAQTIELKNQYSQDITISEYYKMLISRIDRLRLYPTISFNYNNQTFSAYLVNIIENEEEKICVLMIKEYIQDLTEVERTNCTLNTQNYRAFVIPKSSIIEKDDKTYVQLLQKGYFVKEVEVNVDLYDDGKAILRSRDNPDLSSGTTIKTYP